MKSFRVILFFLIGFVFISCEEDFNPYGDYFERYAFTCILKSDQNYQTATLFRSYRPDGYDPSTYTEDPSIIGADIRVWYNDSVFVFRDSSVARVDTSRYKTPFNFYYNDKFRVGNKKTIELEVLLPNGKRLRSTSVTPGQINYNDQSDVIIPAGGKSIIQIIWNTLDEGTFFAPRMAIRYKQNINGEIVEKTKDVPYKYVNQGGSQAPVYPAPSASATIVYDLSAITKTLEEISAGDPNKQNYSILQKIIFSVAAFDLPTSRYVSSTSGNIDDLTVSVDVADYTNIEGGFGLFGSYSKRDYTRLRFMEDYIESFGYNFIVEN
ncbi:MAG TPA: hypothetical protein VLH59_06570 [Ignavibacteriaceae bacterium]|nr:hypothetical protein [Ignavibacteriaceae bacterium]